MAQFDSNTELVRSGQSNMIQRNMSEQARSNALSEWIAEQRKKRQEEQATQQAQWNNIVDLGPAPEPEQEEEQPFVPPSYEEPEEETTPIIQPPAQQTTELHPDREYHEWTPPETEQSSAPLVVPRTREDQTKTNVPVPATPAETYNEWEEFLNQQELDQETDDQVSRTLEPQDQSVLGNGYVQPVAGNTYWDGLQRNTHGQSTYQPTELDQIVGSAVNQGLTSIGDSIIDSLQNGVTPAWLDTTNIVNTRNYERVPYQETDLDRTVKQAISDLPGNIQNAIVTSLNNQTTPEWVTTEQIADNRNRAVVPYRRTGLDDAVENIVKGLPKAVKDQIVESLGNGTTNALSQSADQFIANRNRETAPYEQTDLDLAVKEFLLGKISDSLNDTETNNTLVQRLGVQDILNNRTRPETSKFVNEDFNNSIRNIFIPENEASIDTDQTPVYVNPNARPEVDINALAEARRNNYDVQQPMNSYDRYDETYGPNNEEWETFVRMYEDRGYSREQAMEMATAEVYNPEIEYHPDREYYDFTPTVNSPETETGPGVWEPIGNASQEIVSDYDRAIEDAAGAIGAFIINNSGQSAELARQNAIAEMMFADGISPDRIMMNDPLWNRYEERFNEMYPDGIAVANSTITPEYFTEKADRKINEFGTSIEDALEPAIESASHEIGRQNEAVEEAEKLGIEAGSKEFYDFVDNYQTIADRNEEENLRRARERQMQDLIDTLVETGIPERQAERMVENPEQYGWNYETGRPTLLQPNEQALQQSYWDNIVDSYGWNQTPGQRLMDNYMQMDAPAETPDGLNTAAQALFTDGLTKDQKLHLFDKGGTFFSPDSGVIIQPEFADLIATDPAHAAGSKSSDLIQTVNLTEEQYLNMFQSFLDANPIIQQMLDQGILTYDDIANNFFKNVAVGAGTGSGTGSGTYSGGYGYGGYAPRYYGGGGGYGYGYSGGSSRKSTGWIDQSQAVAKKQQEQRINNIMKNWTF